MRFPAHPVAINVLYSPMFARLGRFVSKYWLGIILGWAVVVVLLWGFAPRWEQITHDGDFAYLPEDRPSVAGQRLMAEAFPDDRAKSQIALVIADRPPSESGESPRSSSTTRSSPTPLSKQLQLCAAYDIARRFSNIFGAASLHRARRYADAAKEFNQRGNLTAAKAAEAKAAEAIHSATQALDDAVFFNEELAEISSGIVESTVADASSGGLSEASLDASGFGSRLPALPPPLPEVYHNRALLMEFLGQGVQADQDRADARDSIRAHLEQTWRVLGVDLAAARKIWDQFTEANAENTGANVEASSSQNAIAARKMSQAFQRLLGVAGEPEPWRPELSLCLEQLERMATLWPRLQSSLQNKDSAENAVPTLPQIDGETAVVDVLPLDAPQWALLDVWTWRKEIIGEHLVANDAEDPARAPARLVVLQLSNEFMAANNIHMLTRVEEETAQVQKWLDAAGADNVALGISGSAAIGGDVLRAAAQSIKNTELAAILLVTIILAAVYRSPLLVAVPLVVIFVSFIAATSIVAWLTQLHEVPGFSWWDFKVFKTTKIFIVVILYGAGVDYCLFLISRYREELQHVAEPEKALASALAGVGDALAASALTTIVGLGMMFFAEFGKFRNSGPAIALCLLITLAACLTLAPAILRALGAALFWPGKLALPRTTGRFAAGVSANNLQKKGWGVMLWTFLARHTVAYPGRVMLGCLVVMVPLAGFGAMRSQHVTYDFLTGMSQDRPSRRGAELMRRYYPVGESGPVIILAQKQGMHFLQTNGDVSDRELHAIWKLTKNLADVPGVRSVRSFGEPTGKRPVWNSDVEKISQQSNSFTKALYITQVPALHHGVTRFEVILDHDPFSLQASQILGKIDVVLQQARDDPESLWNAAEFSYAGVTAGVRDLREVTESDNTRIQILVVAAVWLVLLVILKKPVVCVYLILSVLLSYYVTLGVTQLVFLAVEGSAYPGLNWKTPLFLFVILVAVGQDYNVYLTTRVFEEQKRGGDLAGLRRAIVKTGGIITSCGVIMAGTFFSMTAGIWPHLLPENTPLIEQFFSRAGLLRSMVELGFALSLGVLLDTFVVRTILVPAFLAVLARRKRHRRDSAANPHANEIGAV